MSCGGECLTLITNAVIAWNTSYTANAIDHMTQTGTTIQDRNISAI